MSLTRTGFFVAILALCLPPSQKSLGQSSVGAGERVVEVDPTIVLSDVSHRPLGINVNFLTDRPSLFAKDARPLVEALSALGVHYLRYPGGEKSQSYLWSVPPFTRSEPHLSRTGPKEFWSSNRVFTASDRTTLIDPMDFDEFMGLCRQLNCEPTLVVNHNSYLGPKTTGDAVVPTRQQLIDTAAAWVRYANVTKHYGVRSWEIGNETYLKAYNGPAQAPSDYGKDFLLFARAMKREDSSIKVGLSGDKYDYYRDALREAGDVVDYLVVHSYPCCASFQDYVSTPRFDQAVEPARKALSELTAQQRSRITLALTETDALDFLPGRKDVNDLWHAMLMFEILAQYMSFDPDVKYEEVWNTRWIENNDLTKAPSVFDVLDKSNNLNPTGLAMSLLGHGLLSKIIGVQVIQTKGNAIYGYASSGIGGPVTVYLVNRGLAPVSISLRMLHMGRVRTGKLLVLGGQGPEDLKPSITNGNAVVLHHGLGKLVLHGVSITQIMF